MTNSLEGLKEFKFEERERIQRIADKYSRRESGFLGEIADRIKREGRYDLRRIYSEIYADCPKLANIFKDNNIEIEAYRIRSALLGEYTSRYHEKSSKTFAFLRPDLSGEKIEREGTFIGYFGLNFEEEDKKDKKEKDFIDLVKEGSIIPLMDIDPILYDTPLYKNFFAEWEKRLSMSDVGFKYPLDANRFQRIIALSTGKQIEDYTKDMEDKVRNLVPNPNEKMYIEDEKYYNVLRLPQQSIIEYFPEKLVWINLLKGENIVETVLDFLKSYRISQKREYLELARDYTFSFYQLIPAHFLYSRGGPVIFAHEDINRASITFNETTKRLKSKKKVKIGEFLSWASFGVPFISLRKAMREIAEKIRPSLPKAETPSDRAKDCNILIEKVSSEREDFTKNFNETMHRIEKFETEEIGLNNLQESVNNLEGAIFKEFQYKPKRLLLQTAIAAGIGLTTTFTMPTIIGIAASEGLGEVADRTLTHITEKELQQYLIGGFFGKLTIPIDIWTLGEIRHSL